MNKNKAYSSIQTNIYKASRKQWFEAQIDPFRCGPVSIINAIRYTKPLYVIGPATRRSICVTCDAKQTHQDGFEGTKPANIMRAINKLWPTNTYVTGSNSSYNLINDPTYNTFILLYAYKKFYHYVFMYRKNNMFFVQNDDVNDAIETRVAKEDVQKLYLRAAIYPNFNYSLPQVWALE